MRAAVIGSGFGGLALAIRLQASGFPTVLFEKRDQAGGRAYVYHVSAAILMESNSAAPFDTEGYLRRQASIIDGALEVQLARYPGESQTLFEALRYGVFSGGKRIRPILTLAAGEIFRADAQHGNTGRMGVQGLISDFPEKFSKLCCR